MAVTTETHRLPVRTLVASSAGNAVEWYDWGIYTAFSIYFATQIFPAGNEAAALLSTFATFALAFFFRPLGGYLLGRFADLKGRRTAMLPTFEQVGWLSPALLVLARIAQGMSLGGEVSNASAYLAEIAPAAHRGRYSSFFYISTGAAVLIASLLGFILSRNLDKAAMASYGWRVPFLIGGVLGLIGLWLRRELKETEQFEDNKAKAESLRNPLMMTLKEHPKAVGQLIGVTLLSTLSFYTFFSALTPFAVKTKGANDIDVFLALSIGTVVFIALQYPMGRLADRYGRKPQMLVWAGAMALLVVPLSTLVRPGLINLVIVFCVGLGLYTALTSIAPAIMSELFPTELRGLGIGAWYNLTVALFGGTAPLVIQAVGGTVFFWYVAVGAVITFLVILTLPETKGVPLS
jgi:MHS family alpha-ketoglutarate permease-like MFS transporter